MDVVKSQIEQLRGEAKVHRKKVSECAKDLLDYCEKNRNQDMLVAGPIDGLPNPFQEKKGCSVL